MNQITICNVTFQLEIDSKLESGFLKRIQFNNKNVQNENSIVKVKCLKGKPDYKDLKFLDQQEPDILENSYYREIHNLGLFEYSREKKEINVKYEINDNYPFEPYEVIVDTIFQFIYLVLLDFNIIPVHASVVKFKEYAVMIFGNSGAGKTTLQYSLLNSGCDFFADDVAFVDSNLDVHCSGENILACTEATMDLINSCYGSSEIFQLIADKTLGMTNEKMMITYKDFDSNQSLKPGLILFPQKGEVYKVQNIENKQSYISLIELSISKQFSLKQKSLYMERLRQIVTRTHSYTVERGEHFNKVEHIKCCKEIYGYISDWAIKEYKQNKYSKELP